MKALVITLLVIPTLAAAQQTAALSRATVMEIRSIDSTHVSSVSIDVTSGLFHSVGVLRPAPGQVECGPTGCVATIPAILELTILPGDGRLHTSADSPELAVTVIDTSMGNRRMMAYGRTIEFFRDSTGRLVVQAPRIDVHASVP